MEPFNESVFTLVFYLGILAIALLVVSLIRRDGDLGFYSFLGLVMCTTLIVLLPVTTTATSHQCEYHKLMDGKLFIYCPPNDAMNEAFNKIEDDDIIIHTIDKMRPTLSQRYSIIGIRVGYILVYERKTELEK